MLLIARRNLFSERTRLAISVGGVALSVFLIGILLSLFRGWSQQVGGFVEQVPADLWVASDGTTDFVAAASVLPDSLAPQLRKSPDIETVSPLIVRPVEVQKAGGKSGATFDIQLVAYDPLIGLGGPIAIKNGKSPPGPGDIVVDEETQNRHGVNIGDQLVRGDKSLTVVGIAKGGDFVFTQAAFVTIDSAVDFLKLDPGTQRTFFAVTL